MEALQPILDDLAATILLWFGVFMRVGAAAFFIPSIGERTIPTRVRLGAALAISAIVIPIVGPQLAPIETTPGALARIYGAEILAGLALGLAVRLLVFAIQTAGTIAAQHLSVAQMFGGFNAQEPEPIIATFLALAATAAAVAAGLHIKVVLALASSYDVIPYGLAADPADLGEWAASAGRAVFDLAIGLALPFIVIAFLYNVALGAINRAMPQLMVAFVGAPAITGLGIGLLLLTAPVILTVWLERMDAVLGAPFSVLP